VTLYKISLWAICTYHPCRPYEPDV
jgi:hypothetical protein